MKPWAPGDPVGVGEVFLPTSKLRTAYAEECARKIIEAAAQAVLNAPELATRHAIIARHPKKTRDNLKARVKELWEAGR